MNPSPNFVSCELQSPYEDRTLLFNLLVLPRPGCGAVPDTFHIFHGNHPPSLCTASAGDHSCSSGQYWPQDCQAICLRDGLVFWGFPWHVKRQTPYQTRVTCLITIVTNVGFIDNFPHMTSLFFQAPLREGG